MIASQEPEQEPEAKEEAVTKKFDRFNIGHVTVHDSVINDFKVCAGGWEVLVSCVGDVTGQCNQIK